MADKRLFFIINRAQHRLRKYVDNMLLEKLGVSSVQMGAVFFLNENDGALLKDLSAGLDMNNSAITTLVTRMEKGNLIEKRACMEDGRASRLYLTGKGRSIAEEGVVFIDIFNKKLMKGYSDDEIEIVSLFLSDVIDRF